MTNLSTLSDLFKIARKLAAACAFVLAMALAAAAQTNTFPSSGNVGVGSTSPSALLEVNKSQNASTGVHVLNGTNNTAAAAIVLFGEQPSDGHYSYVGHFSRSFTPGGATFAEPGSFGIFGGSDGNVNIATNYNKKFQVWTTPDNGANWAVRFAVDGSGNVGIGTPTPSALLSVSKNQASGTEIRIDNGNAAGFAGLYMNGGFAGSTGGLVQYNNITGFRNLFVATAGSEPLHLGTENSVRMTVLPGSGNVGIGTTSPIYSLDVNGGVNGFRAKAASTSSNDAIATFENGSGIQAIVRGNGYIGIGKSNPTVALDVQGDIKASGTIFAKYQDLAEWVPSSEQLAAGTVVVLDTNKSNQVVSSGTAYDTRVAGVISAQPGITLGESSEGKVLVATTGRVRVKVDASRGPIQIGDLLVTSDVAGVAMKSEAVNLGGVQIHRPGTIIGKALEPLGKGSGEILVLLSLQ